MVRTSEIGSTTIISFQTKYPTFSGADFDRTMTTLGFQRGTTQVSKAGAQAQQIIYTKENMVVDNDIQTNILNFRLFNTVNISRVYDDIKQALLKLKIDPNSIHLMGLVCLTMAHDIENPENILTTLISSEAKTRIATSLEFEPAVYSLILVNKTPQQEDLQIRIEPLASNPNESFFIQINYKTTSHDKFDNFISKFGESTIRDIAFSMSDKSAKVD